MDEQHVSVPAAGGAGAARLPPADAEFASVQRVLAGRYSIEAEVGRGGMGVVYRARDVALGRPVAIKVLPMHAAATPELRARFLREVRLAAGLSHPNIVPIHLVEEHDDVVCFVMSFIEGETLRERIDRLGPLPPAEVTKLMQDVAWALALAHERGIVHRDIKPENILIERETGRALVTDFGIATSLEQGGLTAEGQFLGTPRFASPEQIGGGPVDHRSDIYSLGATAFLALTGRHVFPAASAQAAMAQCLTESAPPVLAVRGDIPALLAEAVDRSLQNGADDRHQSAGELATALGAALLHEIPEAVHRVVRETNLLSIDLSGWALFGANLLAGWEVSHLTSGGFLMDLVTTVVAFTLGTGGVVFVVRVGEAFGEARTALRQGYSAPRMLAALRERPAAPGSTGIVSPMLLGALALTSAVCWTFTFGPFQYPARWLEHVIDAFTIFGPLVIGRRLMRHAISGDVRGLSWLRSLRSALGRGVLRVASYRLPSPAAAIPSQPTERILLEAAESLLDQLPTAYRRSLTDVDDLMHRLERHADALRARQMELESALAQAGASERGNAWSRRTGASEELKARAESARAALITARETIASRLADVIAALETIRLGLIRLRAGVALPSDLTADLELAREVGEQVEALLYGMTEVERVTRASSTPEVSIP